MSAVDQWRKAWESNDPEAVAELYADEALLEVNMPQWRFQLQGRKPIGEQFRGWYQMGRIRVAGWRERQTEWGAVVEEESFIGDEPDERYFRVLHCFVTDTDQIAEHVLYCTGEWDKETLERQRAEAPMIRP